VDIGKPQRIRRVEPIKDPVPPPQQPAPKEPAKPEKVPA
jgi:hypothetical protein